MAARRTSKLAVRRKLLQQYRQVVAVVAEFLGVQQNAAGPKHRLFPCFRVVDLPCGAGEHAAQFLEHHDIGGAGSGHLFEQG